MIRPSFGFLLAGALCAASWCITAAAQNPPRDVTLVSQEPSLGDAARKAKAQKKNEPAAKHVWTDDDIPKIPREVPAAAGEGGDQAAAGAGTAASAETIGQGATSPIGATAAARGAAAAQGEKAAAADDQGKKQADLEAKWRQRFADAYKKLADDEKDADLMQREYNLKRQQYYNDPNTAMREQYNRNAGGRGPELTELEKKIEENKQRIEKDKQAISDLEDELRREGLPPGWSRP